MEQNVTYTGVNLRCRELDDAESGVRKEIMDKIEERYLKYSQYIRVRTVALDQNIDKFKASLLESTSSLVSKPRPSTTTFTSLWNFFHCYAPLADSEAYYKHKYDLVSLKPTGDTSDVDRLLNNIVINSPNKIIQVSYDAKCPNTISSLTVYQKLYTVKVG